MWFKLDIYENSRFIFSMMQKKILQNESVHLFAVVLKKIGTMLTHYKFLMSDKDEYI